MADLSDVENAMVDLIAGFLDLGEDYLAGSVALSTVVGSKCRIYRGWPTAADLDDDLKAGIVNVTVFPVPNGARNTTRHFLQWKPGSVAVPTLTVSVSGSTVTFGGTGGPGQAAGVRYGGAASGTAYTYRLTGSDTPATVAAEFAARIPGASSSGAVLTVPETVGIEALVGADQTVWMETRRQDQMFCVTAWCPQPLLRDTVAKAVDEGGFGTMLDQYGRVTEQFALPDGSDGFLRYVGSRSDDSPQVADLWRRDIRYRVEYPTTRVQTQPVALFIGGHITGTELTVQWGDEPVSDPQDDNVITAAVRVTTGATLGIDPYSGQFSKDFGPSFVQADNTLSAAGLA